MKYSDIDRFPEPSYSVDVMWHYLDFKLDSWKEDVGLELNPYFQRGHVWTEIQQRKYIEFILRLGITGKDIYFNSKGKGGNWEGPIVCIDGLQRVTAAQKFMRNELSIFGGNYLKDFSDVKGRLPLEITFRFHVNTINEDKDILNWYLWMNEGGTPHSNKELRRIKELLKNNT